MADWSERDIEQVIDDLARSHNACWDELDTFGEWTWLAQPTTSDAPGLAAEGLSCLAAISKAGAYDQSLIPACVSALRMLARGPQSGRSLSSERFSRRYSCAKIYAHFVQVDDCS